MIRKIAFVVCLLIAALPAAAQFTTVTGSNVDAGNQPAGIVWTLCFTPAGVPGKGFQVGGVGQISGQPICRDVEAGVILTTLRGTVIGPMMVADTSLSSPANVCYLVTLRDDNGNVILGANAPYSGYGCVQPSGGTWSFDTYVPSEPSLALGASINDLTVENLTVQNCFGPGCGSGSGATFETNGAHNTLQSLLNFQNGTGTTASNPSGGIEQISVIYGATSGTAAQGNDSRITGAEQIAHKGVASGYAPLDSNALLPDANAPTGTLGKILIGQGPGVPAAFADPLVQGTQADGSSTEPNPVMGGLWDGSLLHAPLSDSSGRQIVSIYGGVGVTGTFWQSTQPVSIASMPTTPVSSTPLTDLDNSIQAPGSATPSKAVQTSGTDGTNAIVPFIDPCQRGAKTYLAISLTANTQLVAGTSSKKIYVCSLNLMAAAATNVAIVEGTGSTCGTSTAGMPGFGGSTAATGWNFAANGGIVIGSGGFAVSAEATAADNLCLLVSAANQISGGISYVVY